MTSQSRPVLLVPRPNGDAVVFETAPDEVDRLSWSLPAVQALSQLLGNPGAPVRGRLFTIRPQDEALLSRLQKVSAGDGYIRGTLRDETGFRHQMAFKETDAVSSSPSVDPALVVTAAQLASIQQQLGRIEDVLEDVAATVEEIIEALRRDQAARVAGAVDILAEVAATTQRNQRISRSDWDRISGLEQVVRHSLIAVVVEMEGFAEEYQPTGRLATDRRLPRRLSGTRWQSLVHQSFALNRAGLQWAAAYASKLSQDGEYDSEAVAAAFQSIDRLAQRRNRALEHVLDVVRDAPTAVPHPVWRHLLTTGIPVGRSKDAHDLQKLTDLRDQLRATGAHIYEELDQPRLALAKG